MRVFEYTSRESNGQIKKGTLEAQDRSSALLTLKSQGRVPLSVVETSGRKTSFLKAPIVVSKKSVFLSLLLLFACIFAVLFFFLNTQTKGLHGKKLPSAKRVNAAKGNAGSALVASANKTTLTNSNRIASSKGAQSQKPKKPNATPQEGPTIASATAIEEAKPLPVAELKSDSEQLIAMLGLPGEEMPPLPIPEHDDLVKDFGNAETNTIVIKETDDDRTAMSKENVAWVKTYIAEAKRMGWTPAQYIQELEKTRKLEALQRNTAAQMMAEIEREYPNDVTAARAELNKELLEKGLKPLDEPEAVEP